MWWVDSLDAIGIGDDMVLNTLVDYVAGKRVQTPAKPTLLSMR